MQICDIHTHIVPQVDDGARDEDMTRQMLRCAFEGGVRRVILTPHYNERNGMVNDPRQGFLQVQKVAQEISQELQVFSGNELYYSSSCLENLSSGVARPLAGSRYVLVEFSPSVDRDRLKNAVNELLMNGYLPILAHVERYACMYSDLRYEMADMGAYFQVNSGSVLSGGFKTKSFCKKLFKEGLVSFVASDCHNLTDRPPNLGDCVKVVEKKYGAEYAQQIFSYNPEQILLHKEIE